MECTYCLERLETIALGFSCGHAYLYHHPEDCEYQLTPLKCVICQVDQDYPDTIRGKEWSCSNFFCKTINNAKDKKCKSCDKNRQAWTCAFCSSFNQEKNKNCAICGILKDSWSCTICTLVNHADFDRCGVCEAEKNALHINTNISDIQIHDLDSEDEY